MSGRFADRGEHGRRGALTTGDTVIAGAQRCFGKLPGRCRHPQRLADS